MFTRKFASPYTFISSCDHIAYSRQFIIKSAHNAGPPTPYTLYNSIITVNEHISTPQQPSPSFTASHNHRQMSNASPKCRLFASSQNPKPPNPAPLSAPFPMTAPSRPKWLDFVHWSQLTHTDLASKAPKCLLVNKQNGERSKINRTWLGNGEFELEEEM